MTAEPLASESLSMLRQLGSPPDLAAAARKLRIEPAWPLANAHVHLPPNFSAFDRVEQAVDLAAEQGLAVLGASNYYDFAAYQPFTRRARQRGIFPLWGLEILALLPAEAAAGVKINDPTNPGRMYICGKGITRWEKPTARAAELMGRIRQGDNRRMAEMTGRLANYFADRGIETGLDGAAIVAQVAARHGCDPQTVVLQERHVARAFQEALFERVRLDERAAAMEKLFGRPAASDDDDAAAVQAEIRTRLMKARRSCFVEEQFVSLDEALELIAELGGLACYPVLADGADPICPWEEDAARLAESLERLGIPMAEFIPPRNDPAVLERYVRAIRQAGIAVVAGTEHNALGLTPMAPACRGGAAIPAAVGEIFAEGAAVVAAHQFLAAWDTGWKACATNTGWKACATKAPATSIAERAALGRAVIARYRQEHEGSGRE